MKNIKIFFFSCFLIFLSSQSKSETKVAFVEMNILINQSPAGKSLIEELFKIDEKNKKRFKKIKKELDKEKNDLNSKKNILSKEEYEKNLIELNSRFKNFQTEIKKTAVSLQAKRNAGMQNILKEINLLLTEYSVKNELNFIIDQKNIIIGKSELNITNKILKLLK
jgi:outer membrane protein